METIHAMKGEEKEHQVKEEDYGDDIDLEELWPRETKPLLDYEVPTSLQPLVSPLLFYAQTMCRCTCHA